MRVSCWAQLLFLSDIMLWTAVAGGTCRINPWYFKKVQRQREAETDSEMEKDRQGRAGRGGKEEGGRDTGNDGKRSGSEGEVSKPAAASQPIKSLEWEEGRGRLSHQLGPVTAQCSVRGGGQAEMREGTGGRPVWREEARRRRERDPLRRI